MLLAGNVPLCTFNDASIPAILSLCGMNGYQVLSPDDWSTEFAASKTGTGPDMADQNSKSMIQFVV
jgi:hypothetical protein